jgi:hypothetical protein
MTFKTAANMTSRSRGLKCPRFDRFVPPSQIRGRGEYRAPDAPAAACAEVVVIGTRVGQVTPESPGIPRTVVYGCFALSPVTGFLATVIPEKFASRELDASVGASGPHDLTVRLSAVRQRRIRVHRIPPHVRDDRERPSDGAGRGGL